MLWFCYDQAKILHIGVYSILIFYFFQVTEIEGRSALLKWGPPIRDQGDGGAKFEPLEHLNDTEFRYEVSLSDKGKDGKYRSIFITHSIECRLTDLRPCTEYHIRIHAMTTDNLRGGASDTVSFVTKSCEPDKPAPPKLVSRYGFILYVPGLPI